MDCGRQSRGRRRALALAAAAAFALSGLAGCTPDRTAAPSPGHASTAARSRSASPAPAMTLASPTAAVGEPMGGDTDAMDGAWIVSLVAHDATQDTSLPVTLMSAMQQDENTYVAGPAETWSVTFKAGSGGGGLTLPTWCGQPQRYTYTATAAGAWTASVPDTILSGTSDCEEYSANVLGAALWALSRVTTWGLRGRDELVLWNASTTLVLTRPVQDTGQVALGSGSVPAANGAGQALATLHAAPAARPTADYDVWKAEIESLESADGPVDLATLPSKPTMTVSLTEMTWFDGCSYSTVPYTMGQLGRVITGTVTQVGTECAGQAAAKAATTLRAVQSAGATWTRPDARTLVITSDAGTIRATLRDWRVTPAQLAGTWKVRALQYYPGTSRAAAAEGVTLTLQDGRARITGGCGGNGALGAYTAAANGRWAWSDTTSDPCSAEGGNAVATALQGADAWQADTEQPDTLTIGGADAQLVLARQ
ncbi:MAG: hypothetical protein LBM66_04525 [Bifidobacteriaceae bacterium]|jgi:hypothetical protein|nr:hypothetical protein [Bifidobacteriaceae bacterium]